MPAYTATAPGKIILFGEHAVVFGRPAIAVPVTEVRARAIVSADPRAPSGGVIVKAPDIGLDMKLVEMSDDHPLAYTIRVVQSEFKIVQLPGCTIRVTSTIPIAAGMGSGAAVSVALIRALSGFLGQKISVELVSALAYEVEKLHHGTPSGIDNTVVTYAKPVYYQKGGLIEGLNIMAPTTFVIGDTGIASTTAAAVGDVRKAWQENPQQYEHIFDQIAGIVQSAHRFIEDGDPNKLGLLMDENQLLLEKMKVSSPALENLIIAARRAGALGAKLSGAGQGGNMIAVVNPTSAPDVANALEQAGAVRTIITTLQP